MKEKLTLKSAKITDAENLNILINQAYRGEVGWTRETEIVAGKRSSIKEVYGLIKNLDTNLFIVEINEDIAACICVEKKQNTALISTFAVNPKFQNQGIGKHVLALAEKFAINQLKVKKLVMVVISQRMELISFYERRGYKKTGKITDYPVHLNLGIPKVKGLTTEHLEKDVW